MMIAPVRGVIDLGDRSLHLILPLLLMLAVVVGIAETAFSDSESSDETSPRDPRNMTDSMFRRCWGLEAEDTSPIHCHAIDAGGWGVASKTALAVLADVARVLQTHAWRAVPVYGVKLQMELEPTAMACDVSMLLVPSSLFSPLGNPRGTFRRGNTLSERLWLEHLRDLLGCAGASSGSAVASSAGGPTRRPASESVSASASLSAAAEGQPLHRSGAAHASEAGARTSAADMWGEWSLHKALPSCEDR
eukprot:1757949-Alexandrium_andersonii.AAC.1